MRFILLVLCLGISISTYSQTWSTDFSGIDSIWSGGDPVPYKIYNDGDSVLYIGGAFLGVNTTYVNGIFKWNGINIHALNQGVTQWPNAPECLIKSVNKLFMGGGFSEVDNQPGTDAFAIWDGSSWYGVSGLPTSHVMDLEIYHDTLFIGYMLGDFKGIIAYAGNDLIDVGDLNTNWVKALAVYNDTLYAGGYFGLHMRTGATTWEVAYGGTNGKVDDMEVDTFNNFLYVAGGSFTVVGGSVPAYPVAMWDGFEWTSMGTIPNWAVYPQGMAIYRGDLYIGGCLYPYSGTEYNNIARWDGTKWDSLRGGCNAEVRTLEVYKDELYVGGYFTYVDDTLRAYGLAKWYMPDTGCGYIKPRVQTYRDTFYISGSQAVVHLYNNNAYVDSWLWDFGDGGTDTVKDPVHIYTDTGTYNVSVTVTHNSCVKTATKTIVVDYPVNIGEIKNKEAGFKLYPNPAYSTLFIEITDKNLLNNEIQITDIKGNRVLSVTLKHKKQSIDISTLPKGVYFVKLGEQVERFVKE